MTQAEIAAERFAEKAVEDMFAGKPLPADYPRWIRENVPSPQGTWLPALHFGNRGPLLAVVEYDDGSHLDVLDGGAVFPW